MQDKDKEALKELHEITVKTLKEIHAISAEAIMKLK
jgi:hypothetical protein